MKRIIIAITFFLSIVLAASAERPVVSVRQVNDVPSNAVQILYNGTFEADPPDDGWSFSDEYSAIVRGYASENALGQGFSYESGITTATHNLDIDFSNYEEPIWLSRCHSVFTWEGTLTAEWDVGEGSFYTKEGMSVAYMWRLSNLDHTGGWWDSNCHTYRIDGLTTWGDQLMLVLSASNNDDSPTTFFYDNIGIWAVPRFKVFLPLVMGGE